MRYIERTGLAAYTSTPGNRGAWIMWRPLRDRAEVITLSFWDNREAIVGFAGPDIDRAVYYPEDDRYLVHREPLVEHYEMSSGTP